MLSTYAAQIVETSDGTNVRWINPPTTDVTTSSA
jgi:hypothetical protein